MDAIARARCRHCGQTVALSMATPCVTGDGRVELWCGACDRDRPVASEPEPAAPVVEATASGPASRQARARGRRPRVAIAAAAVIGALSAPSPRHGPAAAPVAGATVASVAAPVAAAVAAPVAAAVAAPVADEDDRPAAPVDDVAGSVAVDDVGAALADAPVVEAAAPPPVPARFTIPLVDEVPLDEWYPALLDWVHPVPGTGELVPARSSRWFGAPREAVDRPECGRGHCGLDLDGERGQAVVAVAWGTVVRVQRDPGGRGGRYVRIEHPDGIYTSYFHLDRIVPGLRVGDEIDAGEPLGALGASGIRSSAPHLHLALEVPDHGRDRFIDPTPFLARATVIERDPALDAAVALGEHEPGL